MNVIRGLCAACRHHQQIPSPKGTTYILCRLALTDNSFRKYPSLPVLRCPGFAPPSH